MLKLHVHASYVNYKASITKQQYNVSLLAENFTLRATTIGCINYKLTETQGRFFCFAKCRNNTSFAYYATKKRNKRNIKLVSFFCPSSNKSIIDTAPIFSFSRYGLYFFHCQVERFNAFLQ